MLAFNVMAVGFWPFILPECRFAGVLFEREFAPVIRREFTGGHRFRRQLSQLRRALRRWNLRYSAKSNGAIEWRGASNAAETRLRGRFRRMAFLNSVTIDRRALNMRSNYQ